jgi:mycothiol synthase
MIVAMSSLPQLRMRHDLSSLPGARTLPEGYVLRTARDSDIAALKAVLHGSFPEVMWDEAKVRADLLDHPEVPETFLIEWQGEAVATASYQTIEEHFPGCGWVHWVAADPAHGGKNLGYEITRRVVLEAANRARKAVYLTTDDPRLPAIRTYLNLGFEPDRWHESHEERWSKVYLALGMPT